MLVDANLLLYARNAESKHHTRARGWLEEALNGQTRVGLPWESLSAFLRVSTNPRVFGAPLHSGVALEQIQSWLAAPTAWIPVPTESHAEVLSQLIETHELSGNLIPDAHLAALAICHGIGVCSADTDFARFDQLDWFNPLASR